MADLSILTGERVHAAGVVREAGAMLVVPAEKFRALLGRELGSTKMVVPAVGEGKTAQPPGT